jgi:hypothetical protein
MLHDDLRRRGWGRGTTFNTLVRSEVAALFRVLPGNITIWRSRPGNITLPARWKGTGW